MANVNGVKASCRVTRSQHPPLLCPEKPDNHTKMHERATFDDCVTVGQAGTAGTHTSAQEFAHTKAEIITLSLDTPEVYRAQYMITQKLFPALVW